MFKKFNVFKGLLLILALIFALSLSACTTPENGGDDSGIVDTDDGTATRPVIGSLKIEGAKTIELALGSTHKLTINQSEDVLKFVKWSVEGDSVTVGKDGTVTAVKLGTSKVIASYGALSAKVSVSVLSEIETPHEHKFVDGKCECGESDPDYKPEGEATGYYISATNASGTLYFAGTVKDGRFNATQNKSEAVLVQLEAADGGYRIFFISAGAKSYVVMEDNSKGGSFTANAASATIFEWNDARGTFAVADDANNRGFGMQASSTYLNFSPYDLSNEGYVWGEFKAPDGSTPPVGGTDTPVTPPAGGDDNTDDPVTPPADGKADTGYYISSTNAEGTLYFTGTVTGGRFDASANKALAVLVYVEDASGGFRLYVNSSGTKNYILITDKSSGASLTNVKANASIFEWNAERGTYAVAEDANNRGFGMQPTSTYLNFSPYDLSNEGYNWATFTAPDGSTPSDNGDVATPPITDEDDTEDDSGSGSVNSDIVVNGITIPAYSGSGSYVVNGNNPFFTAEDKKMTGYEYSPLDSLGRATGAFARLTASLCPTDDRESISHIKPTGWNQASYSSIGLDHLYDRSHLLAHSLMSDDVHLENFVTGTVYMNQKNMTAYENQVRDFVKAGSDVLYRVTPVYEGNNLICSGLLLEAYSIEDGGDDVCFCVFLYNVQPGVTINYATGTSKLAS